MIVYIPVIAGLVYVYKTVSSWTVVFFIGPAVAAQLFYRLYRNQQDAVTELGLAVRQLERVNLSFATALVTALDARDHYTAGHSATVAVYARDIAKQLGLPKETQKRAHLCGLLHDIGKIGVPTGVLEKEGPLKLVERQAIENHAEVGSHNSRAHRGIRSDRDGRSPSSRTVRWYGLSGPTEWGRNSYPSASSSSCRRI